MKNSSYHDHVLSRRRFLSHGACASLGFTGIVNTLAHLRLTSAALAAGPALGDYKALVVLFLYGGNDSFNMLIPASGHPERQLYEDGRGILAHGDDPANEGPNANPNLAGNILRINYPTATDQRYGLHPELAGMRNMFNAGDLAFLSNVGSLAEPIVDRADYLSGSKILPVQLFSHSNQQEQWQSSIPDKPFASGWGGRVADLLNASYNSSGEVSMNITLAGVNSFQVGTSGIVQYGVSTTGAKSLNGYYSSGDPDPGNYNNAFESDGVSYENNDVGRRLKAFESIMDHTLANTGENLHEVGFEQVVKRARINEGFVGDALAEAESQLDFEAAFAGFGATSGTANQLKMIAKLIAGRNCLGNQRQIFFASMGGFDTHRDMLPAHNALMRDLDPALTAFNSVLKSLGVHDEVLLVSHSDFARTLTPNGSDPGSSGSDHAWGGNAFMMGGPVKGGKIYGHFPSLVTGANLDAGSSRGRWIPTTAVDQFGAVCSKWFGVQDAELETIFPNLSRFDSPFTVPDTNLDFLKA